MRALVPVMIYVGVSWPTMRAKTWVWVGESSWPTVRLKTWVLVGEWEGRWGALEAVERQEASPAIAYE